MGGIHLSPFGPSALRCMTFRMKGDDAAEPAVEGRDEDENDATEAGVDVFDISMDPRCL